MSRTTIDAFDDPRLDVYRELKTSQLARRQGLFVVEGDKLVRRLLISPCRVASVLAGEPHADAIAERMRPDVPLYVVPEAWVERLVGFNFHRGLLACGVRPAFGEHQRWLHGLLVEAPHVRRTLVALPEVQDPENLGSIIRTCGALGVDGVLLGPCSGDPYSRRVLRVSMGTVFRLPVVPLDDLAGWLNRLADEGRFELWATVLDRQAEPLDRTARPPRLALMFGSEGHGLDPAWQLRCRRSVTIPIRPGIDSLNVAVAAGILLYHFGR